MTSKHLKSQLIFLTEISNCCWLLSQTNNYIGLCSRQNTDLRQNTAFVVSGALCLTVERLAVASRVFLCALRVVRQLQSVSVTWKDPVLLRSLGRCVLIGTYAVRVVSVRGSVSSLGCFIFTRPLENPVLRSQVDQRERRLVSQELIYHFPLLLLCTFALSSLHCSCQSSLAAVAAVRVTQCGGALGCKNFMGILSYLASFVCCFINLASWTR